MYNKARNAAYQRKYTAAYRVKLNGWKSAPCMDCGHVFPSCAMDFDHVRGEKKFSLNNGASHTDKDVADELLKCDLVCACCHRIRTVERRAPIR